MIQQKKKKVRIGTCKLCLRDGVELRLSHFIPRALYPKGIKQEFATKRLKGPLTTQMKDYLLCGECERRFDENGESEVLFHIAAKSTKRFPLQERLRLALPREEYPEISRFAGYSVGLDMDKFAYFALSIAWRMMVHDWMLLDGVTLPKSPMGVFQEQIRRYLLGETGLPPNMVILVIVGSDEGSRRMWMVPKIETAENCINIRFLLRGIFFRVLMGYLMPAFYRDLCCTSPRKCLFYGSAAHRMPEIMAVFEEHGGLGSGQLDVEHANQTAIKNRRLRMPDDKKKVGKADRSKVAGGEKYEVAYAARKFGVTQAEVKAAIKKVGNSRAALTKYFKGK